MENNTKKPGALLALGLAVFFSCSFLLIVHIGVSGRAVQGMSYGFGSRSAPVPAAVPAPSAGYLSDFKKGAEIIERKSGAFYDSLFGGSAAAATAPGDEVASQRVPDGGDYSGGDADGDAFEKYYKKNYGGDNGRGAGAAGGSWADMGGGGSASSGGGDGLSGTYAQRSSGKEQQKTAGEEASSSGAAEPGPVPGAGSKGEAVDGKSSADGKLYASLPGKSPEDGRIDLGGQPGASPEYGSRAPHKGGGLSSMPGQKSAVALDGVDEGMKAGSQSNYNSKMSGGAAAAAAAGSAGAAAPAASAPAEVAAGGASAAGGGDSSSSGGASAKGGETDAKTGDKDAKTAPAAKGKRERSYQYVAPVEEDDLFASVVADRRNGKEMKYITEEEAAGVPEEGQLKAGAIAEDEEDEDAFNKDAANRDARVKEKDAPVPDPVNLKDLSAKRKKHLRKNIHAFLKRVENKREYGKMSDISRTSCVTTPDICKAYGVSGSYLTMTTVKGAKLVIGLKYVDNKWRRYTMEFKAPPAVVKPPAADEVGEEARSAYEQESAQANAPAPLPEPVPVIEPEDPPADEPQDPPADEPEDAPEDAPEGAPEEGTE